VLTSVVAEGVTASVLCAITSKMSPSLLSFMLEEYLGTTCFGDDLWRCSGAQLMTAGHEHCVNW
jgi:hypothetical protein